MTAFDAACAIAAELTAHGHVAYLAGGCVRDRLLGRDPKDYDIATDAPPEVVTRLFPRSYRVGEAFGVVLVRRGRHAVEVATFRAEGAYSDGRHPDRVEFTDAEHDARRRDFTINGLFEDPRTGTILDYVGGQADLEAKVVRAIGVPEERIHEDELRMLRGARFAARYRFALDEQTAAAIRRHGARLRGVSRERIGQEIRRMLEHPTRREAVRLLDALELVTPILGVEPAPVGRALTHLERLPVDGSYPLALAAWVRDRHGPGPQAEVVAAWRERLVLSNDDRDRLAAILETEHALAADWDEVGVAVRKRTASRAAFAEALDLLASGGGDADRVRRDVAALAETGLAPVPLLNGHALLELGADPGPRIGAVLDAVYDAQLEGRVTDAAAARALAKQLLDRA